jgi:hypothetical protein
VGPPSPRLRWAGAVLDSGTTVAVASLITLALGLFFTFVWAPHPWGWQGIDQYHELAKALARGEPFGTTDVPWGYAYYGAFFYWLFGDHVLLPVLVQVFINTVRRSCSTARRSRSSACGPRHSRP